MSAPRFPTPAGLMGDRRVRIAVIGAGGTGSMLLDGLARLDCALRAQGHAGFQTEVFDHDSVSNANVGRQRFTASDVGFNKAVLMVHRLNAFYGLDWEAVPERYVANGGRLDRDLVVGCVDQGRFRHEFGKSFNGASSDCLWLDTGNGADTGQVVLGHLGKPRHGVKLPNVYDLYGLQLLDGDKGDMPSCSLAEALARQRWSVNTMVANVALTLLDNLFHRGGLDEHGAFLRLTPLSVVGVKVDSVVWASMGYVQPNDAAQSRAA